MSRLRRNGFRLIGLTGSIGMGKSTAATMLGQLGEWVWDADAAVHRLLARGGAAVSPIAAAFPGVVRDDAVDRQALGRVVFDDPVALRRLERIVHPLVRARQLRFLQQVRRAGGHRAVLDIPLLLETGQEKRFDGIIVVSAPRFLQRQRVLARPGMTEAKLAGILGRQMPDAQKRRRASWVVPSGLGRRLTRRSLRRILRGL